MKAGDDVAVAIEHAAATVARIIDDASFRAIWDSLATFVRTPRRKLVIVIGNHDIEIAFPPVQRLVVDRLAGDDAAARGRIEFSVAGAGYACRVGGARVYCVHGNEVDAWNYNRYEDLARDGCALERLRARLAQAGTIRDMLAEAGLLPELRQRRFE